LLVLSESPMFLCYKVQFKALTFFIPFIVKEKLLPIIASKKHI
jgi:hypothetical protein